MVARQIAHRTVAADAHEDSLLRTPSKGNPRLKQNVLAWLPQEILLPPVLVRPSKVLPEPRLVIWSE